MVEKVYHYIARKNPGKSINWFAKECAEATGVSVPTIYKIRSEASRGPLVSPKKRRMCETPRKNSRKVKYSDFVKIGIRRIVHGFFFKNCPPTIGTIQDAVNADQDLPNFTTTTLYRLLKDMDLIYDKKGKNPMLIERDDIVSWRHRYLAQIWKFRNEGRYIVYTDESWVNAGHTVGKE